MKIHHIGYAVNDIEKSIEYFNLLGFSKKGDIFIDESREVNILFMENDGILVELLSPIDKTSPVKNILSKNGPIPYHVCFITKDIYKEIEKLQRKDFILIEKPKEAIAIRKNKAAFLYNKNVGIIELIEEKNENSI